MNATLSDYRHTEFRLEELVDVVRHFVALLVPRMSDGRITTLPDARTLRYYQSLGLLGRPLRYEGRQAIYGYEHLVRALAIKLLQAQGLSLAQVQRSLAAARLERLETVVQQAAHQAAAGRLQASHERESAALGAGRLAGPRLATCAVHRLAAPAPVSPLRTLVAAEVWPGVWVIVDPLQVKNPTELLHHIATIISNT